MGLDKAPNASQLIGATNALYQAGGLVGALMSGFTSDRFGRRGAIAVAGTIAIVGGILQTASVHIAMFMTARLVTGLGIGKRRCRQQAHGAERFVSIDPHRKYHNYHPAYSSGTFTAQKPRSPSRVSWGIHPSRLHFSRLDRRRFLPCTQCGCAMASAPLLPIDCSRHPGCHHFLYPRESPLA
jgi:hypothetical protein